MSDTPRAYCPACQPDADEFAELLVVSYCGRHLPSLAGLDDAGVLSGTEEVVTNNMWCALIHRDRAEPE